MTRRQARILLSVIIAVLWLALAWHGARVNHGSFLYGVGMMTLFTVSSFAIMFAIIGFIYLVCIACKEK